MSSFGCIDSLRGFSLNIYTYIQYNSFYSNELMQVSWKHLEISLRANIRQTFVFYLFFLTLSSFLFLSLLDLSNCWRVRRKRLNRHWSVDLKVSFCFFYQWKQEALKMYFMKCHMSTVTPSLVSCNLLLNKCKHSYLCMLCAELLK